jgi:hypothetical protein
MSKSILLKDHIYLASRRERLHNKNSYFKIRINKILSIVGLRWL